MQYLGRLRLGKSIVHGSIQVKRNLCRLSIRNQSAYSDEAAVTRCKRRTQPEVEKQHIRRRLDETRRDRTEVAGNLRCSPFFSFFVQRQVLAFGRGS